MKIMRYERVEDIIKLAILLQTTPYGLSLYDIQDQFRVSRRTAERMRDAVVRLFPDIESFDTADKIRRWKLNNSLNLVSFTSDEIAELENTKKKLHVDGLDNKAEIIDDIIQKIKAQNKNDLSRLETDIEALMEAEGFAIRQHPRFKVSRELLSKVREAIKAFKTVHIVYENRNKEIQECNIHPYGVMYAEKHFLVAYNPERQALRLYNLSKIRSMDILDEYFDKDDNFNLYEYSKNSFGVFQEVAKKVILEFDKEVAEDVKNFHFHPTQTIKEMKNGNMKVEFKAGGSLEICWHIFKWSDKVKIIKPASLKQEYESLLNQARYAIEES
jgi:predicted DNA-binding transcriptional regulator YafY